jgi:tetratricopeptide (TPR) repeat protein
MLLARRHRYAEAAEVLARVRDAARARKDVDPKLLRALDGALAVSYSTLRRHDRAEPLFAQQVAERARDRDRDALRYAVALSNHGRNRLYLGDFAAAQRKLDEAIAIYDGLFDGPNGYRAAAYLNRSQLHARQQRFDAALADADAASVEWAGADGTPLDQDPFVHANRLEILLLAERWPRLAVEAAAALDKLPAGDDYRDARQRAESSLALAHCASAAPAEGRRALQAARAVDAGAPWTDPVIAARLDEARARCDAAAGDLPAALRALGEAAARDRDHPPGEVADIARRDRLAAEWLRRLDRPAEAQTRLNAAQTRMRDLALPDGRPWRQSAD